LISVAVWHRQMTEVGLAAEYWPAAVTIVWLFWQIRLVVDLYTLEEWKAELTLVVGYIPRWFTCLQTVTRPSSDHLITARLGVELATFWSLSPAS